MKFTQKQIWLAVGAVNIALMPGWRYYPFFILGVPWPYILVIAQGIALLLTIRHFDKRIRKQENEFRAAAELGDPKAQFMLGLSCYQGRKFAEALKWLRQAADQGNAGAQVLIGKMYENGHGVKRDYEEAYFWFNLPAVAPAAAAIVAKHLDPEKIAVIKKRASEWKPTPK